MAANSSSSPLNPENTERTSLDNPGFFHSLIICLLREELMEYSADSMVALLYPSTIFLTLSLLFLSISLFSKLTRTAAKSVSDPAAKDVNTPALRLAPSESEGLCGDQDPGQDRGHRKKKRAKKKSKKSGLDGEEEQSIGEFDENEVEKSELGLDSSSQDKLELICLYPFTSSGSAIQRRIKQQYDEVVKSNESNGLTLAQVGFLS